VATRRDHVTKRRCRDEIRDRLDERGGLPFGESPENRGPFGEGFWSRAGLRLGAEQVSGGRAATAAHRAS
jgi:hypothetical protein